MKKNVISALFSLVLVFFPFVAKGQTVYSFDFNPNILYERLGLIQIIEVKIYKNSQYIGNGIVLNFLDTDYWRNFLWWFKDDDKRQDTLPGTWILSGSEHVVVILPSDFNAEEVGGFREYFKKNY